MKLEMLAVFGLLVSVVLYVLWAVILSSTNPLVQTEQRDEVAQKNLENAMSVRSISRATTTHLPLPGSVSTSDVLHSIPLEDIRRGCFQQDCIPSIEDPQFVSVEAAGAVLSDESLGIALSFAGTERFYPFPMLETRELVNDVIDGEPILISYCPLCGTGIVFNRRVGAEVLEFGVSGMLWQSNLLMYNRAENLADRNLWSQVLGEAVVGDKTGTKLSIIPSDIQSFAVWRELHGEVGQVLDSGRVADPYAGEYFAVAQNFNPNFDVSNSPLAPMTYVYGIELDRVTKAYPHDVLPLGVTRDVVADKEIIITRTATAVTFATADGELIPDIEGFWFSWIAAHPASELWSN